MLSPFIAQTGRQGGSSLSALARGSGDICWEREGQDKNQHHHHYPTWSTLTSRKGHISWTAGWQSLNIFNLLGVGFNLS